MSSPKLAAILSRGVGVDEALTAVTALAIFYSITMNGKSLVNCKINSFLAINFKFTLSPVVNHI